MGDADDSYDFTQAHLFVNKLREGYDLVMGNRFRGGILPGAMPPLHRYLGNPVLTGIGRLFFKSPWVISTAAFVAFGEMRLNGSICARMEWNSPVKWWSRRRHSAARHGNPTTLSPDGRDRAPHLRTWRDGWRHLRFLLLYSPRWLFLYPGIVLFVLGTAVSALLIRPRIIGNVQFDINTLLFAAMAILIGFQSVVFADSRNFAISEGLLPADPLLSKMFRYLTLEAGLVVEFCSYWLGPARGPGPRVLAKQSLWSSRSGKALRIVIPGAVSVTLGFQIILSSFFLSVLGMARR